MFSDDQSANETDSSSDTRAKIRKIIDAEFTREIENKKKEIFDIYKSLNKATKYLHYLRYSIVNNYYTRPELYDEEVIALSKQTRLHPALVYNTGEELLFPKPSTNLKLSLQDSSSSQKRKKDDQDEHKNKKPKYVDSSSSSSSKGIVCKVKKTISIYNVSQWIDEEFREKNKATHKWNIAIIDDQTRKAPKFISKVRYFLHESYKPHNVVEVSSAPFALTRFGWGEFPVRVQLHFKNDLDRPVDIIHNLKLVANNKVGLTYNGGETKFDVWIHTNDTNPSTVQQEQKNVNNVLSGKNDNVSSGENDNVLYNKENIFFNDRDTDIDNSYSATEQPIISSLWIDHDYIGAFSKIYENGAVSNYDEKLLKCEVECSNNTIEEKSLMLNSCENFKNGITNSFSSSNYQIMNNGYHYEHTNKILNVENSDIFDKKIYRYNCEIIQNEHTNILVGLIQLAKLKTPFDMFKFIIRRMPLITEKAIDPSYKVLHPYACESFALFSNYSIGKQRSLEWYRAKEALKILRRAGCVIDDYSIKEFINCARKYCYTPIINKNHMNENYTLTLTENQDHNYKEKTKSPINLNAVDEWLNFIEENKIYKNFNNEEEVDVISVTSKLPNPKEMNSETKEVSDLDILEVEDDLNEFVFSSLEKYGFKLKNEEIVPGVTNCTANVLIVKAAKCFMEDLLRTSFSCILHKCKTAGFEYKINQDDVCKALMKRGEFKYFTNKYLRSHR